jgi:hypothetical protein
MQKRARMAILPERETYGTQRGGLVPQEEPYHSVASVGYVPG